MKTLDLKRKADNNGANGTTAVQTPQAKNGAMPNSTAFEDKKDDAKKVDILPIVKGKVAEASSQQAEPIKTEVKTEEVKQEPKAEHQTPVQSAKPALNLEETLKVLEILHKRKVHRDNLLNIIGTLDEFKVLVQDENEDIEVTQFPNCKLTIEDDNRNTFSTKNPAIIKAVADFVNNLCSTKLAEIEANLVIPA
ncbi:hypothetical protein ACFOWA_19600 [Pedobacter lithocola]|uniref:Uncharacterized protein n=1 Tax=Pedobacter lithocola TaxID=1908239 RepID=A0ABV8PHF1_9SPHI